MGYDVYIEANICEKATGRVISEEWFTVLWACHDVAGAIAQGWKKVLSRYTDMSRIEEDCEARFPQTALREMASCLFSYAVLPENSRFEICYDGFRDKENRGEKANGKYKYKPDHLTDEEWDEINKRPEGYYLKWDHLQDDENEFLYKAERLREFIYELDRIHFENKYVPLPADECSGLDTYGKCLIPDSFIPDPEDLKRYKENPGEYEWKFNFFDSAG